MRTLATGILTFTLLLSGSAYAGGNPDEEQNGYMTRDPLPQTAPVIPDQYQIQQEEEAKIFAKPQIKPEPLKAEPAPEPITIARAVADDGCRHPFAFLEDLIGGCYELNATLGDEHVLTQPDGPQFETVTEEEKRRFKKSWHGIRKAIGFIKDLKKRGFDVTVKVDRKKRKITVFGTKVTQVEIETDGRTGGSSTATDSNFGDRERDFGPGRGNK